MFKRLAEERLPGQVSVEVYPNSTLFGDATELEALRNNEVQLLARRWRSSSSTQAAAGFRPAVPVRRHRCRQPLSEAHQGKQLLRSMEDKNITGLAYWHNGMKQLSATRMLRLPE